MWNLARFKFSFRGNFINSMQQDLLYYLNHRRNECVTIPRKNSEYLLKSENLGDIEYPELARNNLGITEILNELRELIKIQDSGITFDALPTLGNVSKVLSSDAIYKALLNKADDEKLMGYLKQIINKLNSLESQFNSIIEALSTYPITNEFGSSEIKGVSQKTLTTVVNSIWDKIEELTGESIKGINMIVSPNYFIGDSCTINISAETSYLRMFEYIAFYKKEETDNNFQLIDEAFNTNTFSTLVEISKSCEIKCVAQILGMEYIKTKTIHQYNQFWLFSGNYQTTEDIVLAMEDSRNVISIGNRMRGAYNVQCNQNDHIYIVMGKSLTPEFIRADLNSIEIPFTEDNIEVNGNEYTVFTSVNTYNSGIYNIDING